MQDIAILHHVFLPLGAHQPLVARRLHASHPLEVVVGDRLRADEATLEVGVDGAGGFGRLRADGDGPGADLLLAGEIHSDFERGFIRAETVGWDDFLRLGSVKAARDQGAMRSEGKEYVVKDGDILLFRFNV